MSQPASKAFRTYAWAFTAYLIFVILFGAWVRITHSGAGCGDHWPTCHGDVIPFEPSVETMIEYTHRLTSGLCGIFGIIFAGWAFKIRRASKMFWAAVLTLVFIIFEGAIGAGIVLAELVEDNDSIARAIIISLHLVNTLMLTGSAALAAWWATPREKRDLSLPTWVRPALIGAGFLVIITCMTGAVTALGDTLFPVDPTSGEGLFARVRSDLSPANHFLVQLRIVHPIVAVFAASFLIWLGAAIRQNSKDAVVSKLALVLMVVVGVQMLVGVGNVALYAPGPVQLTHLAIAQVVWIVLVLLGWEMTRDDAG